MASKQQMKLREKDFKTHHTLPQGYFERMEDELHLKLQSKSLFQKRNLYRASLAFSLALILGIAYVLWPSAPLDSEHVAIGIEDYLLAEMSSDELMELYASDFEITESDGIEAYLLEEGIEINDLVNN